jgi:hypothetical protein
VCAVRPTSGGVRTHCPSPLDGELEVAERRCLAKSQAGSPEADTVLGATTATAVAIAVAYLTKSRTRDRSPRVEARPVDESGMMKARLMTKLLFEVNHHVHLNSNG